MQTNITKYILLFGMEVDIKREQWCKRVRIADQNEQDKAKHVVFLLRSPNQILVRGKKKSGILPHQVDDQLRCPTDQ